MQTNPESLQTIIQIATTTTIITLSITTYLAISFGPYIHGISLGKKKAIKAIVQLSIQNPTEFQIWLASEQAKETILQTKISTEKLLEKLKKTKPKNQTNPRISIAKYPFALSKS